MQRAYIQQVLEVLEGARELIKDPARWCQGMMAKDARGRSVGYHRATAVKWCLWGAIERSNFDRGGDGTVARGAWLCLERLCSRDAGAVYFNDRHTHAEVLELFDRAIRAARRWLARAQPSSSPNAELR